MADQDARGQLDGEGRALHSALLPTRPALWHPLRVPGQPQVAQAHRALVAEAHDAHRGQLLEQAARGARGALLEVWLPLAEEF